MLDAEDPSIQRKTLVILAFNTLSQLHPDLELFLRFSCRFPHLIASSACPSIHACCLIIVSLFHTLHHQFSRGFRFRLDSLCMSRLCISWFLQRFVSRLHYIRAMMHTARGSCGLRSLFPRCSQRR